MVVLTLEGYMDPLFEFESHVFILSVSIHDPILSIWPWLMMTKEAFGRVYFNKLCVEAYHNEFFLFHSNELLDKAYA